MIDDEWETQDELFTSLCKKYKIYPDTDVCATDDNSKCSGYIDREMDCLRHEFQYHDEGLWCNPPHSKTKQFVKKMCEQWKKYNIPIMMIIPANSMCTSYASKYIEGKAEYHPIFKRPQFLQNGELSKFPSRNSYFVVIWRKR